MGERPGLSPRDRSLITVTTPAALYRTEQIGYHLKKALDNGLTKEELAEALTHLAFHAGRPNALSTVIQLQEIAEEPEGADS